MKIGLKLFQAFLWTVKKVQGTTNTYKFCFLHAFYLSCVLFTIMKATVESICMLTVAGNWIKKSVYSEKGIQET